MPKNIVVVIYALTTGQSIAVAKRVVDIRQLTAKIPKQALKEYEKAVRDIRGNNTQRAIERLEKSVKVAPDFYNAHLGLAQEYRKNGVLDAAEHELTRAFELNPREGTPLILNGNGCRIQFALRPES